MKVLFVTFIPPEKTSGGAIAVRQSLLSLLANGDNEVDYVGPYTSDSIINEVRRKYYFTKDNSIFSRIYQAIIYKACSAYGRSWKQIEKELDWEEYDVVNLERSLNSYIVSSAKRYNKCVMVRFHNVEYDYYDNVYRHGSGIINRIKSRIAFYYEKEIAKRADILIPITEKDSNRIKDLYSVTTNKIFVNPVCVTRVLQDSGKKPKELPDKYYLATGSLWYGPNADGIMWFIDNVWKDLVNNNVINDGYLLVAGGRPNLELKEKIKKSSRVILIDTPKNMDPYFRHAYAYVAPIFNGAGMKVKVAEALSYGLNVYGTKHAFIGYEHAVGTHLINTKEEFYSVLKDNEDRIDSRTIKDDFTKKYSIERSIQFYRELLSKFVK